jgi:MbtH protein
MTETSRYRVVLNDEGQHSLWPASRDTPPGWRDEGFSGSRPECLDHIDRVWADIRPLSVRTSR